MRFSGLWSVWLAGALLAITATAFAALGVYPPGDVLLARAVQSVEGPGLQQLSDTLYQLGAAPLFALIPATVALGAALRGRWTMATFLLLAALSRGLASIIKEIVERPRPSPFLVDVSEQANGFSFPSGHVLGTVLVWGFLCYAAYELIPQRRLRLAVQATCIAVIALMGLQRVYAGAHWPSDVLAAYLWGALVLSVLIAAHRLSKPLDRIPSDSSPGLRLHGPIFAGANRAVWLGPYAAPADYATARLLLMPMPRA